MSRRRASSCTSGGTEVSANHAKMSPTADWPASKPNSPGTTPSSTTPHIPSTRAIRSPSRMWQMLVPMTVTMVPARVTPAAGAETCASTFATATGVPATSPVHAAACSLRPPARSPSDTRSRDIFSSITCSNRGSRAAKYASGGKPSSFDHIAL